MKNIDELYKLREVKAPEELKEKTLAAARAAQQQGTQHVKPAPRRFGAAKRIVAAACACAVLLGGSAVWRAQTTGQPAGDAVAEGIAKTFGLVAYAADTGETIAPKDSQMVFDGGSGVYDPEKGFYSGCLFRVTGEDIKTISASMDKGALYRTKTVKVEEDAVEALYRGEDPRIDGADQVMVWGYGKDENSMQTYADLAWKLENDFVDAYDPDVSYGFWAPVNDLSDEEDDLKKEWHSRVDSFEGTKLTVTVTFTDDTQQTQTLTLHTGKLAVEYPDDPNGPDGPNPKYTGEVLTDAQAAERGYCYGVYAELG